MSAVVDCEGNSYFGHRKGSGRMKRGETKTAAAADQSRRFSGREIPYLGSIHTVPYLVLL